MMMRKVLVSGLLFPMGTLCLASGVSSSLFSAKSASPSPVAVLGEKIFFAKSLSVSGKMACSTCHDPLYAYGPPDGLVVQYAGRT